MRCLFCKRPSDDAKSIEHIVPESLGNIRGNERYQLPRGAVCDGCNNYFAREVEGPLLAHQSFRNLRAWYQVPTKKGRLPRLLGTHIGTDIPIGLRKAKEGDEFTFGPYSIVPERNSDRDKLYRDIRSNPNSSAFGFIIGESPPARLMSRFLAKMAVEAHWIRFHPENTEKFIDEPHYDRIRNWARRGDNYDDWPHSSREVYPAETLMRHPTTNEWVQAGYAFDLFLTKRRETFFAFCLYGREFVINVGGPSIKGYDEWLDENNHVSPLVERLGYQLRLEIKGGKTVYYLEKKTRRG